MRHRRIIPNRFPSLPASSLLVATIACTIGAAVTSCRDHDDASLRLFAPGEIEAATVDERAAFDIEPYVGHYRFVGGDPERDALGRAIDAVAETFNPLARPMVKDKLSEATAIPTMLEIAAEEGDVIVKAGTTDRASLDGTPAPSVAMTGEVMQMSFQTGPFLQQTFRGEEKGRVVRYEISSDKLVVKTRIFAAQLEKDLEYTLTYERSPGST